MAHLPNPIFYAVGHFKSFYYKWEGQTSQMGEWQHAEGQKKKKKWKHYLCQWRPPTHKTCSETGIHLTSYYEQCDSYFWVTVWKWNIGPEICTKKSDSLFKNHTWFPGSLNHEATTCRRNTTTNISNKSEGSQFDIINIGHMLHLTASFAAVITTTATWGWTWTRNINMGRNKLRSQSTYSAIPLDTYPLHVELIGFTLVSVQLRESEALRNKYAGLLFLADWKYCSMVDSKHNRWGLMDGGAKPDQSCNAPDAYLVESRVIWNHPVGLSAFSDGSGHVSSAQSLCVV